MRHTGKGSSHMLLHDLLRSAGLALPAGGLPNPNISAVREDSRLVRPGDLRRLDAAFFTVNGIISVLLGTLGIVDVLLG